MPDAGRPVRILLLVFLLYLAAWPLWSVIQPHYTGLAVGLASQVLPIVEYPAFTRRLAFDGAVLEVYASGNEPIGRWDQLRFPFYLPFVVLLIALFPGVPWRDRGILLAVALALLLLLHVSLIVVVVQQIHHQFLADHGARWLSGFGLAATTFYRRLVFHFGNQLFSAAAVFLLFLRYGRVGRRSAADPAPLGRRVVTIAAAAIMLLALAPIGGSLLRRPLLRRSPRHAPIQMALGTLHQRAGRPAEASLAFRAALQSDPHNPRAHNNLAVSLGQLGDWQAARAGFERALALDPELGEAYKGLGLTELRLGRPCAAAAALEAARQRLGAADRELGEPYLRSIRERCAGMQERPGSPAGSGLTREGGAG